MELLSPLRREEHTTLSKITLNGTVLDLGGSRLSKYQNLFKGKFKITTVNLDKKAEPEIFHDLEKSLPVENDMYDYVLLINVLEHIYLYQQLVEESFRVLKNGGSIVVAVPFMFPEHPSPSDFHRFTKKTLEKVFTDTGFKEVNIQVLGSGVFMTSLAMFDRLLPVSLRFFSSTIGLVFARILDWSLYKLARLVGRRYNPDTYALGFVLTAYK